jgi:predicted amidohydrolase YtcJ
MRYFTVFITLIWLLPGCSHQIPPATLVLMNGNFFTADSLQPVASAVAMDHSKIVYVGDDAGVKAFVGKSTQVVDLKGAFATPGLIEGHGHFSALGQSLRTLNLLHTSSWQQIIAMTATKAAAALPGTWIEGRGWHQEKWSESAGRTVNGYPYHDALSAVSPNNPVVLYHASGHALIANAKAMEIAGISTETPDPVGGRIVRDAGGRAIGVFEENAMNLIDIPFVNWKNTRSEAERLAEFDTIVNLASQECLKRGITSFEDAGSDWWELSQYERLAEGQKMPVRLWAMIAQPKMSDIGKIKNYPKIGIGDDHFTVRAVKAYFDGALGSYGAWLLASYADEPDSYGQNTTPIDTIAALAAACREQGLQFCVHAIGDRGNREVLNVFEKAGSRNGWRWRVEHAQHIDLADQPRFKKLGVIASMQAVHCTSDASFVVKRLGVERARTGAYAWRNLLDSGARLANGTDTPVEDVNPLPSIYAAVTRVYAPGQPAFFPEQCMSRAESLYSYTLWNAYAAFEENKKGVLKPGMLADIAVFDTDLLHCVPEKIKTAKVLKTIVGGEILYEN